MDQHAKNPFLKTSQYCRRVTHLLPRQRCLVISKCLHPWFVGDTETWRGTEGCLSWLVHPDIPNPPLFLFAYESSRPASPPLYTRIIAAAVSSYLFYSASLLPGCVEYVPLARPVMSCIPASASCNLFTRNASAAHHRMDVLPPPGNQANTCHHLKYEGISYLPVLWQSLSQE